MAELNNRCPCCGSEIKGGVQLTGYGYMNRQYIQCDACGLKMETQYNIDGLSQTHLKAITEDLIRRWNNRASEAELRASVIDEFAERMKQGDVIDYMGSYVSYEAIARFIDKIASQMKGEKEQREFNQKECDWRYNASCIADANCADECDMDCPYKKNEKTLVKGEKE